MWGWSQPRQRTSAASANSSMSTVDICPKCGGSGERPRTAAEDGTEADPDIHPVLSKQPKPCERCGGSGKAELTREELAARNKGP